MKFRPVPAEVAALLERALPSDPRVERRKMFGMPCAFANGHLFFGCFEDRLTLKLRERDRDDLLRVPGAEPFSPMGRTMREYVCIPRAMHADLRSLRDWVAAGFDYVTSLPAKAPKTKVKKPKPATPRAKKPAPAKKTSPAPKKRKG
jgi:TfoX/Sxy family transcriptional regulator of competence genes